MKHGEKRPDPTPQNSFQYEPIILRHGLYRRTCTPHADARLQVQTVKERLSKYTDDSYTKREFTNRWFYDCATVDTTLIVQDS